MAVIPARDWAGGALLLTLQMNRDVSGILDALAGRSGLVNYAGSLQVLDGNDGNRYIILPRTDDIDAVPVGNPGLIYNNDDDLIYVITDTERKPIRLTALANLDISGVLGTTATTIAEGDHTHA